MLDFEFGLLLLPGLVIGLTVHECAHSFAAKLLGDASSAQAGRLTLNPLVHLSPLGTLAVFFIGFGWANPVHINIYNFKKPRLHYFLTSLAGPLANLLIAGIGIFIIRQLPLTDTIYNYVLFGTVINIILMIFNLLPIPPLDGASVWYLIFPKLRILDPGKLSYIGLAGLLLLLYTGNLDTVIKTVVQASVQIITGA